MEIGGLQLRTLRFPGPAGEFQKAGATASLVRELGDSYDRYHRFLADRARRVGGRPEPEAANGDFAAYAQACDEARDVVVAEMMLRRCRAYRQLGRSLKDPPDTETPIYDSSYRLVSAETGSPTQDAGPANPALQAERPPPAEPPDPARPAPPMRN